MEVSLPAFWCSSSASNGAMGARSFKKRAEVEVSPEIKDDELEKIVLSNENVKRHTKDSKPKKFIRVKNRIINIVI